jgi:hypothetical protein
MEYRVQQKATIWYETRVEADSEEQAIELVRNGGEQENAEWWQALDSTEFLDEFWSEVAN